MTAETKPSEPAMRAAQRLCDDGLSQFGFVEKMATKIDRDTQLTQILEALEAAKEIGDHIDLFQGLPLKRIFAQTFEKLDALLVVHKPR